MAMPLVLNVTKQFPASETHYIDLFRGHFCDQDKGRKRRPHSGEVEEHSIRIASSVHERTKCLPLAVEALFHTVDIKDVLERCPELTGVLNPFQVRAYQLLRNWEMEADFKDKEKTAAGFRNFLNRFPLAVVLRVLDLEDIANHNPEQRRKIYATLGEGDPDKILAKTTEAIDALYVHVARRLGWEDVRWRLRDVSLSVHYPKLKEQMIKWYEANERRMKQVEDDVGRLIPTSSNLIERHVRVKSPESMLRKLVKKGGGLTAEPMLLSRYTNREEIFKAIPDLVAAKCVMRNGSRDLEYFVRNLLIPRLEKEGYTVQKMNEGEKFEVKTLRQSQDVELVHVLATAPKRLGGYPVEIQVLTKDVDEDMTNGPLAHEIYKGGAFDDATLQRITRMGEAIRTWDPRNQMELSLTNISGLDCLGNDMGWQTLGLPSNITMLDLLAVVGNVSRTDVHIARVDTEGNDTTMFIGPENLGQMVHIPGFSFEMHGHERTIHDVTRRNEAYFISKRMDELWAATLAGYVHKMMALRE